MPSWFPSTSETNPETFLTPCCCCWLVIQFCLHLCNSMDYSLPDSSVHRILQARILEWVAISFSRGSSWLKDWTLVSCIGRQIPHYWAIWEALPLIPLISRTIHMPWPLTSLLVPKRIRALSRNLRCCLHGVRFREADTLYMAQSWGTALKIMGKNYQKIYLGLKKE